MKTLIASLVLTSSAGVAGAFAWNGLLGLAALGALVSATGLSFGLWARRAPVGWEDETGFHPVPSPSTGRPFGPAQKTGWVAGLAAGA